MTLCAASNPPSVPSASAQCRVSWVTHNVVPRLVSVPQLVPGGFCFSFPCCCCSSISAASNVVKHRLRTPLARSHSQSQPQPHGHVHRHGQSVPSADIVSPSTRLQRQTCQRNTETRVGWGPSQARTSLTFLFPSPDGSSVPPHTRTAVNTGNART